MDNGVKRAVIVWNRRSGKDKVCFNYMIKRSQERVGTYFYLLPTLTQAKKVIWDNIDNDGFRMLDHIPAQLIKATNATELKIELKNGSIIQLIAADMFATSGVGSNPVGVVFSEFSITDAKAWGFLSPILAVNGGWAIFNFTPRGKNHAWALLEKARDNPAWFIEVLTVDDTKVLSPEALAEERANTTADFFDQEYYCKFIDGAAQVFRNHRNCVYPVSQQLPQHGDFKLGIDLAKYQDWTVITPFNLNRFIVYPQDRFNQVDWITQEGRIEAAYRRYHEARITIDSTGLGDPIVEHLRARGVEIAPDDAFKFTEASREQLLQNLAILLEQGRIQIPDDDGLLSELDYFRYELGARGRVKMVVPDGLHDDRVMSLALAVWGVPEQVIYSHNYSIYDEQPGSAIEDPV